MGLTPRTEQGRIQVTAFMARAHHTYGLFRRGFQQALQAHILKMQTDSEARIREQRTAMARAEQECMTVETRAASIGGWEIASKSWAAASNRSAVWQYA